MTEQYELDANKAAEEQIRKCVFNLDKEMVYIYYHYKEGQIFRPPKKISRLELVASDNMNDREGEKDESASRTQQFYKFINKMEQNC